jgi:hypothetical protein
MDHKIEHCKFSTTQMMLVYVKIRAPNLVSLSELLLGNRFSGWDLGGWGLSSWGLGGWSLGSWGLSSWSLGSSGWSLGSDLGLNLRVFLVVCLEEGLGVLNSLDLEGSLLGLVSSSVGSNKSLDSWGLESKKFTTKSNNHSHFILDQNQLHKNK